MNEHFIITILYSRKYFHILHCFTSLDLNELGWVSGLSYSLIGLLVPLFSVGVASRELELVTELVSWLNT